MTDSREYDSFGLLIASSGATPTPFGFVGGEGYQRDADSGLMLLGARYYDASIGRFITRDPIGYRGGLNLYGYCGNDPVNCVDPEGMQGDWDYIPVDGNVGPIITQEEAAEMRRSIARWWDSVRRHFENLTAWIGQIQFDQQMKNSEKAYRKWTSQELNKSIGNEQRRKMDEWFKSHGTQPLEEGVKDQSLQRYREIARRALNDKPDNPNVQRVQQERMRMIQEELQRRGRG